MARLTPKDKLGLAYIYELDEFKSLTHLCDDKRMRAATEMLSIDMSQPGSSNRVSMLQGQIYAFEMLLLEIKKIHKDSQKNN